MHELQDSALLLESVHAQPSFLASFGDECSVDSGTDDQERLAAASLKVAYGQRERSLVFVEFDRLQSLVLLGSAKMCSFHNEVQLTVKGSRTRTSDAQLPCAARGRPKSAAGSCSNEVSTLAPAASCYNQHTFQRRDRSH